jgi:hypothetical protein
MVVPENRAPAPAVAAAEPSPEGRAPPPADAPPEEPDCPATMFSDQPPGAHGLHVFEDPGGLLGYEDAAGRPVISPRFRFAYEFSEQGVAAAIDLAGRPVFLDTNGAELAEAYFYDNGPDYFSSGRARIVGGGKVGFIDEHGNVVIAPTWDGATSYCGPVAAVCNGCSRGTGDEVDSIAGGSWGIIDRRGRALVPLVYPSANAALAATKQRPR